MPVSMPYIGGWRKPAQEAEMQVRGIFADDASLERGAAWAISVLQDEDIDPHDQPVRAIKALRTADKRLSLIAARYLMDLASGKH
ncbi:hypothetical protein [Brachybacterium huguangmaarense]